VSTSRECTIFCSQLAVNHFRSVANPNYFSVAFTEVEADVLLFPFFQLVAFLMSYPDILPHQ
jgi:hypothetical protein